MILYTTIVCLAILASAVLLIALLAYTEGRS